MADPTGYTGTPETNDLLKQLMAILEKNRAERQGAEQEQSRLNASSGFAAGLEKGLANRKPKEEATSIEMPDDAAVRPEPARTTGIGARYIAARDGADGLGTLSKNYRATTRARDAELNPYEVYAPNPAEQAIREEQKKRFTQNLMMQRGQTGGPLGGAGAAPPSNVPTTAGVDPAVVGAVERSGGPVAQITPSAQPAPVVTPAAAQGLPQPDLAMLDWAAARGRAGGY